MNYIDQHLHTNFSPDAAKDASIKQYIKQIRNTTIPGLLITDHVDIDSVHPLFSNPLDYGEIKKQVDTVRILADIPIYIGVEMGLQPHVMQQINNYIKHFPFDSVIASVHYVDKQDLYNQDFYKGKSKQEAYDRYLAEIITTIKTCDSFDIVGHYDYVVKYAPYEDNRMLYSNHKKHFDQLFDYIIKENKTLEINTSLVRYKETTVMDKKTVLNAYYNRGGRNISLGSDAHQVSDIQADFDIFIPLLQDIGFTELTYYIARKAKKVSLHEV